MKKIILGLLVLVYSSFVLGQVPYLSGIYISKSGDQEYKLHLMNDSSFVFYQPQNNIYGLCETVKGTWSFRKNKLMLNTNLQEYYEFKKKKTENEDSISFKILSVTDFGIGIYPFIKVFVLNDKGEKLYEGETNENSYVKFPSSDIKRNKVVIPHFLSMYLSGEYSNYIERGFDYELIVVDCGFEIWKNKVLKVKNGHILLLKEGKYKYEYIKSGNVR